MKLFVKEKLFSIHNRYYIYNENEEQVYEIESKAISIGDKTTIYDKAHNVVAYIEQEIFHLTPHYNVYIENEYKYQIKKKFQIFKNDYELSNAYKVDGSTFNLNFAIWVNLVGSGSQLHVISTGITHGSSTWMEMSKMTMIQDVHCLSMWRFSYH